LLSYAIRQRRFGSRQRVSNPPPPEEVVIRMVATGVCHTDMLVRDQDLAMPLPAVLGHEGSGIVEGVGSAVTGSAPAIMSW
jgi:aryl-alcohol dehydrogenase